MTSSAAPPPASPSGPSDGPAPFGTDKGLRGGALGLFSSTVIGLASTAPAYSMAATLGVIVAVVGLQSPVVIVLAFIPMFLIAYGYKGLNQVDPDCGTTFTWAARAFGPHTGWLGGWGIVAADIIVMANLAQIAGQYGFQLIGAQGLAHSTLWTMVAGVVWIALMTWICYIGIEVSANLQKVLLTVEVVMLLVLAVTALVKVYSGTAPGPSTPVAWAWFDPTRIRSLDVFTTGILTTVFIYWGWDSCVSVNEETADRTRTPGRAAVMSTVILLCVYLLVATSAQSFAGAGRTGIGLANPANSADVLSNLGTEVFGSGAGGQALTKLLILMVLTSAAASTQTTILPTARTTLSMATFKALPAHFARVHPRFLTPTWSTVGMGLVSIVFFVLLSRVSENLLADSIGSVGLMIAFYYGLTGFACVWYFRKVLLRSPRALWTKGIMPGLGGVMLLGFFVNACVVYAAPDYGSTSWTLPFPPHWHLGGVFVTGIGSLVLGAVLMLVYRLISPAFFRKQVIAVSAHEAHEMHEAQERGGGA
ncbi:APC family permease [Streptomyces gilvosporeus]|uniref:Amino acid transporter n=1 Tax=Streptomyces gilvosporeus TaxID=553510 RepID=A0A1V0U3V7_9ACTN|nr:APC family permease [Streptomyces gilvosporeus]ARF59909.1 amino acid transporter [Streptomyces gilvosporeus]